MNPAQLREDLFSALARNEGDKFMELCQAYRPLILDSFADWTKVPKSIRNEGAAVEAWGRSLIFIAQYFEAIGHPELLERLTGRPDNPWTRWSTVFSEASQVSESGQYTASSNLL